MKLVIEIVGWYGTLAILSAYFLASFSFMAVDSIIYQLLNASGALGIVAISFYKKAYQPGILNLVWMVIAVIALANILV